MTISNRTKVILAGVIILIAIILILLFLPRPGQGPSQTPTVETPEELPESTTPTPVIEPEPEPMTEAEVGEVSASTVGKIFVERYGSFSTESDLANIEDVIPLATASYAEDLQDFIDRTRLAGTADEYYGVTTRVVSVETTDMDVEGGTATLEILTQREESFGTAQNTSTRYQTIILDMAFESEEWRVDLATWQ